MRKYPLTPLRRVEIERSLVLQAVTGNPITPYKQKVLAGLLKRCKRRQKTG